MTNAVTNAVSITAILWHNCVCRTHPASSCPSLSFVGLSQKPDARLLVVLPCHFWARVIHDHVAGLVVCVQGMKLNSIFIWIFF